MKSARLLWLVLGWLLLAGPASIAYSAPPVSLELVTQQGFPIGGERRWIAVLQKLDFTNIRIRSGRAGDEPKITNRGTSSHPSYHVLGALRADNRLVLPGARPFTQSDRAAIRQWLEKVRAGGGQEPTARPGAFGLTGQQLVELHTTLATPTAFSTQGKPIGDVIKKITAPLPVKTVVNVTARETLSSDEVARDELIGLSAGTAMAAALRPLGLVMVPRRTTGRQIQLVIVDSRQAEQSWPVGWPTEKSPRETMPEMMTFLNVEIDDIPLDQTLEAVRQRLDAPLLFDHNSMARHRIDPRHVKVTLPKQRTYYMRIVDRILFQAKLKSEIRVDENERSFLWVSTIKK